MGSHGFLPRLIASWTCSMQIGRSSVETHNMYVLLVLDKMFASLVVPCIMLRCKTSRQDMSRTILYLESNGYWQVWTGV